MRVKRTIVLLVTAAMMLGGITVSSSAAMAAGETATDTSVSNSVTDDTITSQTGQTTATDGSTNGSTAGETGEAATDSANDQVTGSANDSTVTSIDDGTIALTTDNVLNFKNKDNSSRAFKYVKLASYKLVPETPVAGESQYLALTTTDGAVKTAIETAIGGLKDSTGNVLTLPAGDDPLMWLTKQSLKAEQWRLFISGVETALNTENYTYANTTPTVEDTTKTATFNFASIPDANNPSGPGLYLLIDNMTEAPTVTNGDCTYTYGKMSDILIGTKVTGNIANGDGTLKVENATVQIANGTAEPKANISIDCKGNFTFQKTGAADADKNGLNGVSFTVKKLADNPATLTYADKASFDTAFGAITSTGTTVTSASNAANVKGLVTISNLTEGWYLIKENADSLDQVSGGYMNNDEYMARLLLHVTKSANSTSLAYDLTAISDGRLFTKNNAAGNTSGYDQYMNIQNTDQLPKTGAAGTAIFAAIAVLLAGAASLVFLKSRKTKHALRY